MADFFTRIAERTLGLGPIVRADLPPLFAPPAQVAGGGEFGQGARAVTAKSSVNDEQSPRHSGHRAQPSQAARLRSQGDTTITADELSQRPVPDEVDEWRRQETFDAIEARGLETKGQTSVDESDLEPKESSSAEGPAHMARRAPLVARPSPGTFWQTEIRALERAARAPVPPIQITIGRVDVRAVPLPPQRATVAERKAASRLSLEQYLRERNEGRR